MGGQITWPKNMSGGGGQKMVGPGLIMLDSGLIIIWFYDKKELKYIKSTDKGVPQL